MRVWTYVIAVDGGAAPNCDPPTATLVVCKPRIRRSAKPGNLVLAFNGGALNSAEPHSVRWAGVVSEVMPMEEYWSDPRFQGKKPGRSKTPDNIYRPTPSGDLVQVPNVTHLCSDITRDITGLNALILEPWWYFKEVVAVLPEHFGLRMVGGRRGHRRLDINDGTWRALKLWLDQNAPYGSAVPSYRGAA